MIIAPFSMDNSTLPGGEHPMVSVVMVAYNSAPYIEEAIRGVVGQRCPFGVQLVICDDASSDDTPDIVSRWARQFPGIIDFHRNSSNLGVQGNYLKALSLCRGKYIAMCDADDYWCSPSKLKRQVDFMEQHPEVALTYHPVINYFEASREKSISNGSGLIARTPQQLAASNTITNLSVLYRAAALNPANLPAWLSEVRLIDYALHMLAASRGEIHFMRRSMGVYRHLPSAIWSQAAEEKRRNMAIDVRRHLISELSDRPDLTGPLREAIARMEQGAITPPPSRRPILSRCRALISRLIPRPLPPDS